MYTGYQFGAAQWAYLSMREELQEATRSAASQHSLEIENIQRDIISRGENLGITINPEDIKIEATELDVTITIDWEVEIAFPFYSFYRDYSLSTTHRKGL